MATLIDVATPGPALSITQGTGGSAGTTLNADATVSMTTAGTVYNIGSQSLGAGTYTFTVVGGTSGGAPTGYLSLTSASSTNSWPVQSAALGNNTVAIIVSAVIKLTTTTTVYFNMKSASSSVTGNVKFLIVKTA